MKWLWKRGWQWMQDFKRLCSLPFILKMQVTISFQITRFLFDIPCFRPLYRRRIRLLSAHRRRNRCVNSGCNPVMQPCWIKGVVVVQLCAFAEAKVSPLTPAWFIILRILYVVFHMNSLRVDPVGHHCGLRTKLFYAYHLMSNSCQVFYLSQIMEVLI